MAIHTEKTSKIVKQITDSITSITCDCCGKEIPLNENDLFKVIKIHTYNRLCNSKDYDCCSFECAFKLIKSEMEKDDINVEITDERYKLGQEY